MKPLLYIFTLFIFFSVSGQDYRGKRITLSYQPGYSFVDYLNPEMLVPVAHQKLLCSVGLSTNLSIGLTGQYSFGRKKGYYTFSDSNAPSNASDLTIKDILGGIQLHYFRKTKQAHYPFGQYFSIGIEYGISNSYRFIENSSSDGYVYPYEFYDDEVRVSVWIPSFYIGRNFLIRERLLLGYGIQAGFVFGGGEGQPIRHFGKPFFNLGILL